MLVKELTSKCLEKVIFEIKKEENMTKIQTEVMDPLIRTTLIKEYILTF